MNRLIVKNETSAYAAEAKEHRCVLVWCRDARVTLSQPWQSGVNRLQMDDGLRPSQASTSAFGFYWIALATISLIPVRRMNGHLSNSGTSFSNYDRVRSDVWEWSSFYSFWTVSLRITPHVYLSAFCTCALKERLGRHAKCLMWPILSSNKDVFMIFAVLR